MCRFSVHGQPLAFHRSYDRLFEGIVGCLNKIWLVGCTNARAEMNESERTLRQFLAAVKEGICSKPTDFVAAHGHEYAIPRRSFSRQHTNDFQPTGDPATALARALPPSTARCRDNKRG